MGAPQAVIPHPGSSHARHLLVGRFPSSVPGALFVYRVPSFVSSTDISPLSEKDVLLPLQIAWIDYKNERFSLKIK